MPQIILTIGVPGSGKNTWARDRAKKSKAGCVIVNRDDLRTMTAGGNIADYKINNKTESDITQMQYHAAELAIARGRDVIVADTNLKQATIDAWEAFAKQHNCTVEKQDFFKQFRKENAHIEADRSIKGVIDAYRKRCHAWNLIRPNSVPVEVVDRFIDTYILARYWRPQQHVQHPNLPEAIVVDVDGTLAEMADLRGPFDWKKVGVDKPIDTVIETVRLYKQAGYKVIVMSGRDAICRPETEAWLKQNGVQYDHLFMRPEGDQRPDNLIKEELFFQNVEGNYNVRIVLDDRDQVCEQWRAMGLKVYQVAPGDF